MPVITDKNPSGGTNVTKKSPKSRFPLFLKVISIVLAVSILSLSFASYFMDPSLISRITGGILLGFRTSGIAARELEGTDDIKGPTENDTKVYSHYTQRLSKGYYTSLNKQDKETFNEIKVATEQITAHLKKVLLSKNALQQKTAPVQNLTLSTTPAKNAAFSNLKMVSTSHSDMQLVPVYTTVEKHFAENTNTSNTEMDDDDIDAAVLNQITTFLYLNGYIDLATAVSSMAAAEHPLDAMSALSLSILLRESNADEDAFNVLQYGLKLDPNSEPILYSLGMCALDLRNTSFAETCFMRILSNDSFSGPAHQGMMLCYMDTGNYSSAFMHMLEGARDGYTSMVTEVYKTLRKKNKEYFEIAKPIFEQYELPKLVDFSQSRTPFDNTLDTPDAQLSISQDIKLGIDSSEVYAASENTLNTGMQYGMSAYSEAKNVIDDALKMLEGMGGLNEDGTNSDGSDEDSIFKAIAKSILDKIFDSADSGTTVSSEGWLNISYEAEVFWMNILEDYASVELEENLEEYMTKPLEDAIKEGGTLNVSLMNFNESFMSLCGDDPIAAGSQVLSNLVNNNSVYDTEVQKANKEDLDKYLEAVNPKLEEGYLKTAEFLEEYWLYYSRFLGQIGNDETYNRYQQARKTTVASALTPYVAGGTINSFMVAMNFIVVDADNNGGGGGAGIVLPAFPDFPGSQMGIEFEPPTQPDQETNPDEGDTEPEENTPEPEDPPSSSEDSSEGDSGVQGSSTVSNEETGSIFVGPFTITLNESGFEFDATAVGSVNLRCNAQTGDISIFGGAGLSLGAVTSGTSARAGLYSTINLRTGSITSGTRVTADGQLAGNGIGYENEYSLTTGADTTTITTILLHQKETVTTIE